MAVFSALIISFVGHPDGALCSLEGFILASNCVFKQLEALIKIGLMLIMTIFHFSNLWLSDCLKSLGGNGL